MRVNNQPNGVTERLLNMPERALPTFSESLKGVAVKNFPGATPPDPQSLSSQMALPKLQCWIRPWHHQRTLQ